MMSFNEEELLKIKKATSGFFKKQARATLAQALCELKPKIDAAKQLSAEDQEKALKALVKEATNARHYAMQSGANSYGHPKWAAAAACESWLHELISGTPESLNHVEQLVIELMNR
jgi:hypothetical protein